VVTTAGTARHSNHPIKHCRFTRSVVLVFLLSLTGCGAVELTRYYETGAVASASPIASEVGREIFQRGGNAYDVAVGVGFVLAVVYPQAGNLGGGGFAVLHNGETGHVVALDFRETAPMAVTEDMYLDRTGEVSPGLSTYGALSAGVPGTVAGLHALWEKFGTLPWEDLVRIAAGLADTGFVIDDHLAQALTRHQGSLTGFDETTQLYFKDGRTPRAGHKLILKDLAETLYQIAAEGPDAFYSGTIAEKIVTCMEENGGLLTQEDLTGYEPVWRTPIHFRFDSLEVYSMSPPSSGGIVLGQILKLLEPYDFSNYFTDSPEYIHLFCEASRLAYSDRSEHLGDPEYWQIPADLLSDAYLERRRELISLEQAAVSKDTDPGHPGVFEHDQTTHFSVCDSAGNMVAITTTLNSTFGSKLVVGGAGFLLNNEMDDFSIRSGYPNQYGLVGSEANKIEPGKRMLSSMSPTLVLVNDAPFLVLGSPGGSKIITTVAQAILSFSRFKLSSEETVTEPRFHHQWLPDILYMEEDSYNASTEEELERRGHTVKQRGAYGDVQLIHISASGMMCGASDPRGGGSVAGY